MSLFIRSILRALLPGALGAALGACAASAPPSALPPVTPIMIPPPMAASATPDLSGGPWHWLGGATSAPRDAFTIEFTGDGRALVRADCNRGSGRYTLEAGDRLTLSAIATTKMGCPAGSQDAAFLRQLGEVERYRVEGNALVLQLRGGATMRLVR